MICVLWHFFILNRNVPYSLAKNPPNKSEIFIASFSSSTYTLQSFPLELSKNKRTNSKFTHLTNHLFISQFGSINSFPLSLSLSYVKHSTNDDRHHFRARLRSTVRRDVSKSFEANLNPDYRFRRSDQSSNRGKKVNNRNGNRGVNFQTVLFAACRLIA